VSVGDGLVHAAMVGATENYLSALAVELGHGATHQALLTTVPILVGATSMLLAPTLSSLLGGRRRFAVACALLQALSQLWFAGIAAADDRALMPLLCAKVMYYVGGTMMSPAWSAWMAELTQGPGRARYFALRSGGNQASILLGFAFAGLMLERTHDHAALLDTYVLLFWCGLGLRTLSAAFLGVQYDPELERSERPPRRRLRVRHTLANASFRVPLYYATLMFGTNIAVPFFVPYWLGSLGLGYRDYAVLIGTAVLVKAMTMPFHHHLSARVGMERMLYIAGLAAALVPAAWALAHHFAGFVLIQVVSGLAWGAIEYASFQLLLDGSSEDTRLEYLSLVGTMGGLAGLMGSLLGGLLIDVGGLSFVAVFLVSTCVRALPLLVTRWAFGARKSVSLAAP
jgi:MFS family permease